MPPRRRASRSTSRSSSRLLCILSRSRSLYSTKRLLQAAKAQGHRAVVLDTLRCHVLVESGAPQVWYGTERVPPPDVLLPRIGTSITRYGLAVVSQFEAMGVPVVNGARAIATSRDKLRCLQVLAREGIPVPRTLLAHHRASVPRLVEQVGGLPVIVKLIQGTQGVGVMIATTAEEAQALLNTFWDLGHDILLQQFVRESEGRDVRALVVGDRVVAAMRRQAKAGEFRSNIHRGAEGTALQIPREFAQVSVQAARVLGLEVAGVDLLESKDGPRVVEVNSSPGFEGLEGATHTDIASAIVQHAAAVAGREVS
ncbi:MAG: RimK family alpha-L-glutamate ligase [Myxococcales bacterium]